VSSRMNWDRVNRENRAWSEARRAPSRRWQPDDNWMPYERPEAARWPRTKANTGRRRKKRTRRVVRVSRVGYAGQLRPAATGDGRQASNGTRTSKQASRHLTEEKRREIERAILARWEREPTDGLQTHRRARASGRLLSS
jgi:hypothetical protein